ncbi:MAG: type I-C CRISPR-associated endonuclease Cas1c [Lentimicrobium sp.]|jgi:CRISPR-associated protein Cas1|nr:type I-C CRISPR-associated endonuclease Cas1c [Lentimicrobium sp.]
MRKLLNTLYVTNPEAYLSRDGENVVVRVADIEKFRIPVHNIEGIVCFGYPGASPSLMGLCAERNIGLSFLTENGRFWGRVSGPVRGNVLLRREQFRMADDSNAALEISRIIVAGKIANCRNVLQRAVRDHGKEVNSQFLTDASVSLDVRQKQALRAENMDSLRGIEGDAANSYFGVFNHLIISQKDDFIFNGRSRRPPKDRVNAMLSFVYSLLAHETESALESAGLDPYVGFLHTARPGRASLALDLMEEFRPYLADRLVLTLINRKQVSPNGFKEREESGVIMDDETRKEVISAWQKRKQDEIQHPFLKESVPIGLLPYTQALLFSRFVRGDVDNYPVFVMK